MQENEIKTCKMCFKEIPDKAKKCPYCQHWQNKWSLIVFNPLFAMIPMLILIILYTSLLAGMIDKFINQGEEFSKYKNSILVEKSKMKFGVKTSCKGAKYPTVVIIGKLKNHSNISWKEVALEVQIFNKEGKLIDTKQEEKYSFVVPAHEETAFKISFEMEFPKVEYNSFMVFIRSAKDERKRF